MEAAAPDRARSPVKQTALILVLGVCAFASGFGLRIVDPSIPLLAAEFGTSLTVTSLVVTAFSISYALGQPILGPLGDVMGKSRMIIVCGSFAAVLVLACAAAPGFTTLVGLRAISGFAAGGIIPLSVALLSDRVGGADRQVAIGRFLMAPILGQMFGAATAGIVADRFGWRAVFVLTGLLLIVAIVTAFATLRTEAAPRPERFAVGSILDRYRLVLANPTALPLHALIMLLGGAAFGILPYVAAILSSRLGTGSSEAGLVIAGFGIGGVVFAIVIRAVFVRLGPALMGRVGGLASGAAIMLFALPLPWTWDMVLFVVFGFFYYMLHNTLQAQAADLAPEARGSAVSLFAFSMFTAQGIGPVVVGQVLDGASPTPVLVGLGVVLAGVGLTAERVLFRRP
jgi:MFS transporter, YNFM family, putative membrane transport protein